MLLVLVACLGVLFWAWRGVSEASQARDLASTIRSGERPDRLLAMSGLWLGPVDRAKAAVPALFAAMDDPDAEIRASAAASLFYALRGVRDPEEAASLCERLLLTLGHEDPDVRTASANLLGRFEPLLPPRSGTRVRVTEALLAACEDREAQVRAAALSWVATRGLAKLPLLLKASADRDEVVRRLAIFSLFPLAHQSREAYLAIVRAVLDPSPRVQLEAVSGQFASPVVMPPEAVPILIRALEVRQDPRLYWKILKYLAMAGPAGKEAIPALIRLLPPNVPPIYDSAVIRTLGAIAPGSPEVRAYLPTLLKQMKTPVTGGRGDRHAAIDALSTCLWDPEVLAAMREAVKDPDEIVRRGAAESLSGPGTPITPGPSSPPR